MSSSAMRFFPNATAATAGATLMGSSNVALDLSEINEAGSAVTTLGFEIQQLDAMAAGIDNLIDVADSVSGANGFSEQTFAVIQAQAAHIVEGTGLTPTSVNMQSFGEGDNSTVTRTCMLSLSATAKNIWNAIIKAIKDLFAKVTQWFAKITNAVPALIKKFEKLREEARSKTAGFKEDKEDITLSSGTVKALGEGKTPKVNRDSIKIIAGELKGLAQIAKDSTKVDKETNAKMLDAMKGISVDSNKSLITALTDMSDVFTDVVDTKASLHGGDGVNAANNKKLGLPEFSSVEPMGFGNKAAIVKLFTDGSEGKVLATLVKSLKGQPTVSDSLLANLEKSLTTSLKDSKLTLTIGDAIADIESAESQEIKAFVANDVVDICSDTIEALELLRTFKEDHEKSSREIGKFTDEIIKTADKIENAKVDDSLNKVKTLTSKVVKAYSDMVKGFAQFPPQASALVVSTANTLYTVGGQSISAHK